MKRAFVFVFVLGLAVALVMLWRPAPATWQPGTRATFVAFTDTNGVAPGTNALFVFSSIPRETTVWNVREISQYDGSNWHSWAPLPTPSFAWANLARTNNDLAAVIPLQSTSAPARIVIELECEQAGFIAESRLILQRWFRRNPAWKARRPTYHMTNYVPVAP